MALELYDLRTEYRENPIGIDVEKPRFFWKLRAGETDRARGILQTEYRVTVGTAPGLSDRWDSGTVKSGESVGVEYAGTPLENKTRYYWQVQVTDSRGETAVSDTQYFETGLGISDGDSFGGKWIGPNRPNLEADVRSVFALSMEFRLTEGSTRIGLVFGEGDRRAFGKKNWFCYEIEAGEESRLLIWRVGISPEDPEDMQGSAPFAVIPLCDYDDPQHRPLLTKDNLTEPHTLCVRVTGDCAFADFDGKRVDVTIKERFFGKMEAPRQLNPLGDNDVNTWPRLNRIGWYLRHGQSADILSMEVRNLRVPYAAVYEDRELHRLTAADGDLFETKDPSHTSIPMLRRSFAVREDSALVSARLYAAARGIYECSINGQKVTDTWFNPGQTQYDRRMMYQTYDITDLLKAGKNAIGVILASGWWSDAQTFNLQNYNYYGDRESFLGRLELTYADGSGEVITTDPESWKYCGEGPWTYAGLFHGEHYDALRAEAFGNFSEPDYDDSAWEQPEVIPVVPVRKVDTPSFGPMQWPEVNLTEPVLAGQTGEGVKESYTLTALSVTETEPGVYVYDMGVNVAGVPEVKLCGERGRQAMLRYAELLYPDLPEFEGKAGTIMVENLRDADCTDLYTFRGDPEGETYMPRFTFRGYRYIEIRGVSAKPALSDVKMKVLSSVPVLTGSIRVSDELTNRFIANVRRSMQSNFISIPTDCPQRNERMGWDGDTAIFTRSACLNSAEAHDIYVRWLEAMRDLQEESGKFPDIAPVGGGFGGFTYESSAIQVTFEVWQQFADTKIVADNYPALKRFMEYSARNYEAGSLAVGFTLGDWLALKETDLKLICHAFYGYDAYLMAKLAGAIGEREDEEQYQKLYESLKDEFDSLYFDPETGRTRDDTQCSYALPLAYKMVKPERIEQIGNLLSEVTKESDYRVYTGFFGTTPLCPMLTETGHEDDAFRLISQTKCPSWLYPVTQGATSVWERWDSFTLENGFGGHNSMNSFNHYSLGAVLEWMYMYVLGIRPDENNPGYRRFILEPHAGLYDNACAEIESPYGKIRAEWKKSDNCEISHEKSCAEYIYHVIIPENTAALLHLPGREETQLGSGEYCFTFLNQ